MRFRCAFFTRSIGARNERKRRCSLSGPEVSRRGPGAGGEGSWRRVPGCAFGFGSEDARAPSGRGGPGVRRAGLYAVETRWGERRGAVELRPGAVPGGASRARSTTTKPTGPSLRAGLCHRIAEAIRDESQRPGSANPKRPVKLPSVRVLTTASGGRVVAALGGGMDVGGCHSAGGRLLTEPRRAVFVAAPGGERDGQCESLPGGPEPGGLACRGAAVSASGLCGSLI